MQNSNQLSEKELTLLEIQKLKDKVSPEFYEFMLANHKEVYNY